MNDNVLKTSADDLFELVKSRKKISIEEAASILKVPDNVVQSLVDFLVEEKIFGIEYKFTTPFIYISKNNKEKLDPKKVNEKKVLSEREFFEKASKWNIPPAKVKELWIKYVKENIEIFKENFNLKATLRKIPQDKIDILWEKFKKTLK